MIPRLYLYGIALATTLGVIGTFWYTVHVSPMNAKDKEIKLLKEVRDAYEIKINNLNTQVISCKSKSKSTEFEAYFEGGGGIEESNTSHSGNIFLDSVR